VLVTGSRTWRDADAIRRQLEVKKAIADSLHKTLVIMHGGCAGADTVADEEARELGIHTLICEPLWEFFKQAAGPIRNSVMVALRPDVALVFHENLARSKGTKDCVERLKDAHIPYMEVSK
ncbi:MAG TPA: SLOG family protein, partial [Candidatus Cybelea sp.]|nr:SLOG family protein [Candidatus Cybelea sp.]